MHITITPAVTLAATIVTWTAALTLLIAHLTGNLPLGLIGTDLWCCWLLALGCTGFWTTFLRVTARLIAEDWQAGRAFGDLTRLPLTDPCVSALLAGNEREDGFVRSSLWPIFGWIGGLFWGVAALYSGIVAGGWLHPRPSDLLLSLVAIMIPAVQCTSAAVNGPPLTRQRAVRRAAALAHHQLRQRSAEADAVAVVSDLIAREPERAETLLRDIAAQARARGDGEPITVDLHVVNGNGRSARDRHY